MIPLLDRRAGRPVRARNARYERVGRRRDDSPEPQWFVVPRPRPLWVTERGELCNALAFTQGHQRDAAACLHLSDRVFKYKLKTHHIPLGSQFGAGRKLGPRLHPHKPRRSP